MSYRRNVAAVGALAALAVPAAAGAESSSGAEVFNYGQCVSTGFPAPSQREFGPLVLVFNPDQVVVNVPPGLQQGPAENPLGQIGCPVTGPS
jgi:hypothetical protein